MADRDNRRMRSVLPASAVLDPAAAYRALSARDARFDGRLFVGVTSTGIYCRPICRVRTPGAARCRFFATAAQAEAAAFRPCLKCRPELAPGAGLPWSTMDASRTLAHQAADALDARLASGEPPRLVEVAARLGIGERHLRRIFHAEHGVTPVQYLQTRRLLTAKQLLTDSALPIAQVAHASGFGSLRRFNATFAERYRMSPSRLRGHAAPEPAGLQAIRLKLAHRLPYDVAGLVAFAARRAICGVEHAEGRTIRRSLRAGALAPTAGWIEARWLEREPLVELRFAPGLAGASARIVAGVRRWLDLDADPAAIDAALEALPGLPGIRLPGSLDGFELAVRAVLGQQVTVAAARTLAARLVEHFGEPIETPWPEVVRTFPSPATLANVEPEALGRLGIVRTRVGAIAALARGWPALEPLLAPNAAPEPLIERLRGLPGIGPWTAHYIAMRALGWPDAFPPNDVAVTKAIGRLGPGPAPGFREAELLARAWQPWRSYAVLRLWGSVAPAASVVSAQTAKSVAFDSTAQSVIPDQTAESVVPNQPAASLVSGLAGKPVTSSPTTASPMPDSSAGAVAPDGFIDTAAAFCAGAVNP